MMEAPSWCSFWRRRATPDWEAELREAALAAAPARRHAVDAGAHLGTWTVPLAGAFQRVTAFEPCTENRACLKANVAKLGNVLVREEALSSEAGEVRLALAPVHGANSGQRMIGPHGERAQAVTLDELGLPVLDLLKLDLEGWELPALVGARETIRRCRPAVVIEESVWAERHGLTRHGARGFLIGLGYRVAASFPDDVVMVSHVG